jgi:hypothetical protein
VSRQAVRAGIDRRYQLACAIAATITGAVPAAATVLGASLEVRWRMPGATWRAAAWMVPHLGGYRRACAGAPVALAKQAQKIFQIRHPRQIIAALVLW